MSLKEKKLSDGAQKYAIISLNNRCMKEMKLEYVFFIIIAHSGYPSRNKCFLNVVAHALGSTEKVENRLAYFRLWFAFKLILVFGLL